MGMKAQEILLRGEAIPEDMAAKFVESKINSPEVAHHGENLCCCNCYILSNKLLLACVLEVSVVQPNCGNIINFLVHVLFCRICAG